MNVNSHPKGNRSEESINTNNDINSNQIPNNDSNEKSNKTKSNKNEKNVENKSLLSDSKLHSFASLCSIGNQNHIYQKIS